MPCISTRPAIIGALLALPLSAACGDKDPEDSGGEEEAVAWTIDNTLALCSGEGQWFCPRGQREGSTAWEEIPCGIDGLDYVWGTTWQVQARVTGFSDPAVDGCGDQWALVSVDSQVFDGGGKAFALEGIWDFMVHVDEEGGTLGGDWPFVCETPSVCEDLALALPSAPSLGLQLQVGDAAGDPLILRSFTTH